MAHKVNNSKGFLIIALTKDECAKCNFGVTINDKLYIIDDDTGKAITGVCYYVAVLNRIFGKDTLKEWLEDAPNYKEDKLYEQRHFNYYAERLGI